MRERKKDSGVKMCPMVNLEEIDFIEPPPSKRLEESKNDVDEEKEQQSTLLNFGEKIAKANEAKAI